MVVCPLSTLTFLVVCVRTAHACQGQERVLDLLEMESVNF